VDKIQSHKNDQGDESDGYPDRRSAAALHGNGYPRRRTEVILTST